MVRTTGRLRLLAILAVFGLLLAACGGDDGGAEEGAGETAAEQEGAETAAEEEAGASEEAAAEGEGEGEYVIGVSNTLVGNGWREQMICAVKAEALASGQVSEVIVANRNGGPNEQLADMQNLISQGVNAIIVNPTDREALNPVIDAAAEQGIVVVAVDQAVTSENAYVVTNDQVAYGRLGAEWLFEAIGGSGNVVEMRGIDGVPADTDRHDGFTQALEEYPDIEVIAEPFTGWDFSQGGQQAVEILNAEEVDGIWTSGIDYTVVNAFETTGTEPVPVIGADNNEFLNQLMQGQPGAAVTNPASIGGVGTAIALQVLNGEDVERETLLTPEVWDMESTSDTIEESYLPDRDPTASAALTVDPYTSYTPEQLLDCRGPGE